ncbi:uncharacterized protein LOC134193493 [Corticium candelabrum]|uniref:uncharacterized protein LOC134193493 n=1 Tax=Corticium candelabrum TaxID=121492 RepID=UPI002E252D85|nr:uncharacterized protein LOC134193493 [Corticium candelabrum]
MAENVHNPGNKMVIDVIIENKQIQFRVGTGADVSLMNEKFWVALGKLKLSKDTERLRNVSGNLMSFKALFQEQYVFGNTPPITMLFYVKHGKGSNILGMDWVRKTNLSQICITFLTSLTSQKVALSVERPLQFQCQLKRVLDTFSDVFGDDLGFCSQSVSIHVRPDAELKVFPYRRLPIRLWKKIEAELDRQVK